MGLSDLLVVVFLVEAAQNALADDYRSILDDILLVAPINFWSYAFNWLGYHISALKKLVHPPPLQLIKNGESLNREMRKELITEDELKSILRRQGVDDLKQIK